MRLVLSNDVALDLIRGPVDRHHAPVTTTQGRSDWLVFAALGVMWGSSYLFIKIGVETLTPLTLVTLRVTIGALFLAAVVLVARERIPRDWRVYRHIAALAIFNIVLPFILITWAERSVSSSLAAILTATVPLFAIVLAAFVLRDEPFTAARVAGLAVGFAGVVLLVGPSAWNATADPAAQLALLGASLSYSIGVVYARRYATGLRPPVAAFLQVGTAALMSAALALIVERPFELEYPTSTILAVVWLGLVGSGLAYVAFFRLVGQWGATRTSTVAYILPVVGIALGFLFAGESVDAPMLAGTALIIGGVAIVNARRGGLTLRSRRPRPEAAT
jgi:drug/metabolite transporter (DMT)-like permease